MNTRIGILDLQGAVREHARVFERVGQAIRPVRLSDDLEGLSHLVLPGGESTTIRHLLNLFGLAEPIATRHRAGELALFGVCAGAILLGQDDGERPARLGLLDARFERNGYGRQLDSFRADVELESEAQGFPGIFIRAPRIRHVGPGVEVLARHAGEPVLLRAPGLLASTFHPELSHDDRLHRAFLEPDLWSPARGREPQRALD